MKWTEETTLPRRQHLLSRLARTRITLIVAPSGAGKTVLLRQHIAENPSKPYIYVDAAGLSREEIWAQARMDSTLCGSDGRDQVGDSPRSWSGFDSAPVTFVFDGVECGASITDDIEALLDHTDHHAIVATRSHGLFDGILLRSGGEIIGPRDMTFTAEEHASINERLGLPDNCGDVELKYPFHGRMAADLPQDQAQTSDALADAALDLLVPRGVGDSLLAEQASILPTVSLELLAHLSTPGTAALAVGTWEDLGIGRIERTPGAEAFVFEPSYGRALRRRLRSAPRELREKSARVIARRSLERSRYSDALIAAMIVDDYYLASWIVRHQFLHLDAGHLATVAPLLEDVDPKVLFRFPALAVSNALASFAVRSNKDTRRRLLSVGSDISKFTETDDPEELLWLSSLQATAYRLAGAPARAAQAGRAGLTAIAKSRPIEDYDTGDSMPLLPQIAVALVSDGDLSGALEMLHHADRILPPRSQSHDHVGWLLAAIHAWSGHIPEARRRLKMRPAIPLEEHDADARCARHLAWSLAALQSGYAPAARQALAFESSAFTDTYAPLVTVVRSMIELLGNHPERALECVETALRRNDIESTLSLRLVEELERARARVALSLGEPRVKMLLQRLPHDVDDDLLRALHGLMERRYEESFVLLARYRNDGTLSPTVRASVLVTSACAGHGAGRVSIARSLAQQGAAVLRAYQLSLPLAWLPARMREWFELETGFRGPFAPHAQFPETETDTPVLSRRELLVLRAMADGLTRDEIAQSLHVSPNTIKSQTRSIYRKLGARTRQEALAHALATGQL